MARVQRTDLERPVRLPRALQLIDDVQNDETLYPNDVLYLRPGSTPDLLEEFIPVVHLARSRCGVRSVRLTPASHPGPDAVIHYWWRPRDTVQVVCSNEDYQEALLREQLLDSDFVVPSQHRSRDKTTRKVTGSGMGLFDTQADVDARVERIVSAVAKKEAKFYRGTTCLLVQDDADGLDYLVRHGLRERVDAGIRARGKSTYRHIYVNYGDQAHRVI